MEDHLIQPNRTGFHIELEQSGSDLIIVGITAWVLGESIHTSKSNGHHILDPCVTPKDISIDKHHRLITTTLNQISHGDMALLL